MHVHNKKYIQMCFAFKTDKGELAVVCEMSQLLLVTMPYEIWS